MNEKWLPVTGYEGLYEVSDLGRVRSLPRQTARGIRGGRVLAGYASAGTHWYPVVRLSRKGKGRNFPVHTLVMRAHVGRPAPGQEVRHGPDGKADPSLANLCYGTRAENIADRVRDGQHCRGERQGRAKLTWAAVDDIRCRVAAGERQSDLAAEYGVSRMAVHMAFHGRTWRDEYRTS